jgi:hypothetical protein
MSAVFDPVRRHLIFFGGYDGSNNNGLNDVWELSLSSMTWTQLPTGPSPRWAHSAIYDPVRDRMIIFGGTTNNGNTYLNDVWSLSLSGTPSWNPLPTGPRARRGPGLIYDPVRDRLVLFGGVGQPVPGGQQYGYLNDAWQLSLSGATRLDAANAIGDGAGRERDLGNL